MLRRSKIRAGIITFLVVMFIVVLSVASAAPAAQNDAVPLLIGFYGNPNSPAALGMQVAVAEINNVGAFQGADGRNYRFIGLVTEDLSLLGQALVVFVSPDSPIPDTPVTLTMPIVMLSPTADLRLQNVEGQFYRGMTSLLAEQTALIDFIVRFGAGQSVILVGDGAVYEAEFSAFTDTLAGSAITVQTVATDLPEAAEIAQIVALNPNLLVYYGSEENAGALLANLSASGWAGLMVYPRAYEASQAGSLQLSGGVQVLGLTAWSNSAKDTLSQLFRQTYVTQTGKLPTVESVSAYDVTWAMRLLVQRLGADPANLAARLPIIDVISTTQGQINPAQYGGRDLFQAVQIYALQALGGMDVLARYDAGIFLGEAQNVASLPTPTPQPSATPSQAVVIVKSNTLNVRTGPGENYPRITSLKKGDQVQVMGATSDFTWFFVQSAGGLGWVKGEFVDLFNPLGGVTGIQPVQIPPTPTLGPTFTPATPPDLVIDSVTLSPTRIVKGQAFSASVTIRNAGDTPALNFVVGATWLPDNVPTTVNVPSLEAFGTVTVVLQATVNTPGNPTVNVTVDQTNQVTESNEGNNTFAVNYVVDGIPTVDASNSYAVNQLNFAGTFPDIDWTGTQLNALNGATFGIITGTPYENVNVSMLKAALITNNTVGTLAAGAVFGMRTGEGHCGVFRIDGVTGVNITFTFRMYTIADCAG